MSTKNTFLDCDSPWVDAEIHDELERNNANRPHSDPSSSRSSSASSMSGESSGGRGIGRSIVDPSFRRCPTSLERGPDGTLIITQASALSTSPTPDVEHVENWTLGAEGHSQGACRPCRFFFESRCRDGAACTKCHLHHEEGDPRLKFRVGKAQRQNLKRIIQKLKERMLEDGPNFNLDDVEFVKDSVKESPVLRAKILKELAPLGLLQVPLELSGAGSQPGRVSSNSGSAVLRPAAQTARDAENNSDCETFSL